MKPDQLPPLCRRRNLRLKERNHAIHQANPKPVDESPDQEHGNVHRTGLDSGRDNANHADNLDCAVTTNRVREPSQCPAAYCAAGEVDAVYCWLWR